MSIEVPSDGVTVASEETQFSLPPSKEVGLPTFGGPDSSCPASAFSPLPN